MSERIALEAMVVHQWLEQWNDIWREEAEDGDVPPEPEHHFYFCAMEASLLRKLAAVEQRQAASGLPRADDYGIQRKLEPGRSSEIHEFTQYGYPWSQISESRRESGKFDDLRKPGWLPTSIIINIRNAGESRGNISVHDDDVVCVVRDTDRRVHIELPLGIDDDDWAPSEDPPIEVIDGQHRLWSFDREQIEQGFELPVVAFHNLAVEFRAYLFYTINITPKKIDRSLAFDMYPLLRTQSWLERFEGPRVYRESRAQELAEALWSNPASPWQDRISMLGGRGSRSKVTQAAWVRALLSSYIKSWTGRGAIPGGLFGAPMGEDELVLPWGRHEQAAFLIFVWQHIEEAVRGCDQNWARELRALDHRLPLGQQDPAFAGKHTYLNTDQGVRGVLQVTNDLFFRFGEDHPLGGWLSEYVHPATDNEAVAEALDALHQQDHIVSFMTEMAEVLSTYDWRSVSAPGLSEQEKLEKGALRGSGGYRMIRGQLLAHLSTEGDSELREMAATLLSDHDYDFDQGEAD